MPDLMRSQQVTWKQYISAAGISYFIPVLALLLQTGWTLLAHPYRLYQASLVDVDLSSPMFWLGNAYGGLIFFLVFCLVIKRPLLCWLLAVSFLVGLTWLLVTMYNSVDFK